jgi:hypothetical protein
MMEAQTALAAQADHATQFRSGPVRDVGSCDTFLPEKYATQCMSTLQKVMNQWLMS